MELKKNFSVRFSHFKGQLVTSRANITALYNSNMNNEQKTKVRIGSISFGSTKKEASVVNNNGYRRHCRAPPSTATTTESAESKKLLSALSFLVTDRQMESILLDVSGDATTERCSAALSDRSLADPKIELSKEIAIRMESIDSDLPLSTVF